jgi:hypothetical protein
MDIGKAFSFVFDDEQWVTSILIMGLLILVPILGSIMLIGYMMETARNVAMNSPRPLPKWDNFGEKLSLGFAGFVISLVYALPIIVLAGLITCVAVALGGASGSEEAMGAVLGGTFLCILPLIILAALVIQPLMLAAIVRYLQTGRLGDAFQFGTVVAMVRQDLGGWVVLWLLSILAGIIGSLGSMVIIGFIFTVPYSQAAFGHLLGQKLQQLGRPAGYDYPSPVGPTM